MSIPFSLTCHWRPANGQQTDHLIIIIMDVNDLPEVVVPGVVVGSSKTVDFFIPVATAVGYHLKKSLLFPSYFSRCRWLQLAAFSIPQGDPFAGLPNCRCMV